MKGVQLTCMMTVSLIFLDLFQVNLDKKCPSCRSVAYNIQGCLILKLWHQRTTAGLSAGTVSATESASESTLASLTKSIIRLVLVEQFFPINLNWGKGRWAALLVDLHIYILRRVQTNREIAPQTSMTTKGCWIIISVYVFWEKSSFEGPPIQLEVAFPRRPWPHHQRVANRLPK